MAQWYYAQNDEQIGPVSAAALKEMAQRGKLRPDDLIWREGMQRWAPAHKVRGLFPAGEEPVIANGSGKANDGLLEEATAKQGSGATGESYVAAEDVSEDSPEAQEVPLDGPLTETAMDELPLGGPEESKLHVPALGVPSAMPERHDSNDPVEFESVAPAAPSPSTDVRPISQPELPPRRHATSEKSEKTMRVDVPMASSERWAVMAMMLQTTLWIICVAVVLGGGLLMMLAISLSPEPTMRLAAAAIYATLALAAYLLAHSVERLCRIVGHWNSGAQPTRQNRSVRERNWQRFQ